MVDYSDVERLVAEVVEDTRYKDTVKIVIRLDGGPEYEERGLRVFPYVACRHILEPISSCYIAIDI